MAAFKDRHGREWHFEITPYSMKRVKELTGVHMGKLLDDELKPLNDLLSDAIQFVDVMYCLCKPQCDSDGVTDEQFGMSLVGDPLEAAAEAFMEALADFFPTRQGKILRKLAETSQQLRTVLANQVEERLDEIKRTSIESASSMPQSPELSPGITA